MCRRDAASVRVEAKRALRIGVMLLTWKVFTKPVVLRALEARRWRATTEALWAALRLAPTVEAEWYLEALLLWQLAAPLLRALRPGAALALALVASGCAGYNDLSNAWLNLDATLGFLPFFALGLVLPCDVETLAARVPRNAATLAAAAALVCAWRRAVMTPITGAPRGVAGGTDWPDSHGSYEWAWQYTRRRAAATTAAAPSTTSSSGCGAWRPSSCACRRSRRSRSCSCRASACST